MISIQRFRYRVVAAFVKGCAAGDALGPQPSASDDTESFNCLVRVVGAGGGVDAVASQHRRENDLIEANEFKEYPLGQICQKIHDACFAAIQPGGATPHRRLALLER